jgi:hypothetical protein
LGVFETTAWLSREQRAEADFGNAMTRLRSHFDQPEARTATDAMTEATLRFAACERHMRRAERLEALDLREAEAKELAESALADNERGLGALPSIRPLIDELSREETDPEALSRWRESSPRIRAEWRANVVEVDLSAHHAGILNRLMDECCDAVDERGAAGLGHHLSRALDELEKARRSDDRGTHAESFPWWKIVAVAIVLGISIGVTLWLIKNGAPWWNAYLVWLLACIAVLLVVLAC